MLSKKRPMDDNRSLAIKAQQVRTEEQARQVIAKFHNLSKN
jgi:hypothetical protein